jgi:AraC-like DNA-binding protein
MDVLSAILERHPVRGVILSDGRYGGRWAVEVHTPGVAGFHLVLEGGCLLRVPGEAPVRLEQGDVVVVPGGAPHVLADAVDTVPVPLAAVKVTGPTDAGGARLACGAYQAQSGTPPALWSALPPLIHLRAVDIADDHLLRSTMMLLTRELDELDRAPGAQVLVDRLVDALFVGVLRRFLATHQACTGWLGALRDDGLGRAIGAIHASPSRDWKVSDLARLAGMSRTTFARRFDALVGTSPAAFLQGVRIDAAARLLETSELSVAEVAAAVGYASEFSFSRTFRRLTGEAPGRFRARSRTARPAEDARRSTQDQVPGAAPA